MSDKKFSLYTNEDLKEMQAWSLQRKIQVTQTRIMEWYDKFEGQVYVSFSGGKDSTVLLDLARRVYPDIEAVFVDTGLEYPELREFVKAIDNVTWLKPEMNFKKVIQTYGYPLISKEQSNRIRKLRNQNLSDTYRDKQLAKLGKKWRKMLNAPFESSERCCDVMKKRPLKKYEKRIGKHPILGTMTEESYLRKSKWLQYGCNAFNAPRPISQPMSFWTEQDVLEDISRFNLKYASVYGEIKQDENGKYYTTGCNRTGCVFCGFGCHLEKEPNRFQRLKKTHLKLWDYCMRPMDEGGLGMRKVLEYINVKVE